MVLREVMAYNKMKWKITLHFLTMKLNIDYAKLNLLYLVNDFPFLSFDNRQGF